jgi:hypothetical protein
VSASRFVASEKNDQIRYALSAIVRSQLGQLLDGLMSGPRRRNAIVSLGTPEGDLHEFGILLSAILCAERGFSVT